MLVLTRREGETFRLGDDIATLDVEGTPIVRAWNVVHTLSKLLSPAAEAFRYFMLERAEGHMAEKYGRLLRLQPAA